LVKIPDFLIQSRHMATKNQINIKQVTWQNIRLQIEKVNPILFSLIDQVSPGKEYSLYKVRLPYGYESAKDGKLNLPISAKQQEDLGYNYGSNPMCLMLKNSIELFVKLKNHTIPCVLLPAGELFGIWLMVGSKNTIKHHPAFIWNITAGARSIFMLPKISVTHKYKKLKETFRINAEIPKNLLEHWQIFRELANSKNFGEHWNAEVLLFGKKWLEKINDPVWRDLKYYLLQTAWDKSEYLRNITIWDLVFSIIQRQKNLRPNPYIADTAQHLLALTTGVYPGLAPAIDDTAAPMQRFQKAFVDVYELDDYLPIIMQPRYYSMRSFNSSIYYTLQYPTTMSFSPTSTKLSNKIVDLCEIKYLLEKYLSVLKSNTLNLHNTPLSEINERVSFDYFHTEAREAQGIRNSAHLCEEDDAFSRLKKEYPNRKFPSKSPSLRGCIRIRNKN